MANIGTLRAWIVGDATSLLRATRKASAAVTAFTLKTERSLNRVSMGFTKVGRAMTMRMTAPIAALGYGTLKAAGNFERGMNRVLALTQAGTKDFAAMEKQALLLGRTTMFTATQAADAMGYFALAGYEAEKIMGAMPDTLQLAASAQIDLGTATKITTGIMAGYRMESSELADANDVLVKAFTSSKVDLTSLGETFKMVGPIAKAAGMDFKETTAIIGALGQANITGTLAGTQFRRALINLQKVTPKTSKALDRMGVSVKNEATGKLKSFIQILREISVAQTRYADTVSYNADIFQIFGARAGPGIQALLGLGIPWIEKLHAKLDAAGGIAERVANVQMKGLFGAMIKLKSAIEGSAIAIAKSGFLTFFTGLALKLTNVFRALAVLEPKLLKTATQIAFVVAAVGPLLITIGLFIKMLAIAVGAIGGLIGAFAFLLSPIGLVVGAIVGLMVLLVKLIGPINAIALAWTVLESIWLGTVKGFKYGVDFMKFMFMELGRALMFIPKIILKAWLGLKIAFFTILGFLSSALESFVGGLGALSKALMVGMGMLGMEYPQALADMTAALGGAQAKLKKFTEDQQNNAGNVIDSWDTAWESFAGKGGKVKAALNSLLTYVEGKSQDKADRIKEIFANMMKGISGVMESGVAGAAAPEEPEYIDMWRRPGGPGSGEEAAALEASSTAWTRWLERQTIVAGSYDQMWGKVWVDMSNNFSQGIADVITKGENFRDMISNVFESAANMIIQQLVRWFIANVIFGKKMALLNKAQVADTVATETTKVGAKAAGAAPHPWLIPVFVAFAMAALAKATGGASSAAGGGGGGYSSPDSLSGTDVSGDRDSRPLDLTIRLEGGTRIMTPEEQADQIITVLDEHVDATGGTLRTRKVIIED